MILFASYKNAANFLTFPSKQLPSASLSLHPSLPLPFLRTPCPLHLPDVLVRPVSLSSIQEEDRGKSIFSPSCIHYRWVAALVDIVHNPGPRIPILVFFLRTVDWHCERRSFQSQAPPWHYFLRPNLGTKPSSSNVLRDALVFGLLAPAQTLLKNFPALMWRSKVSIPGAVWDDLYDAKCSLFFFLSLPESIMWPMMSSGALETSIEGSVRVEKKSFFIYPSSLCA